VSDAVQSLRIGTEADRDSPRLLGILAAWRLNAYGYALATVYAGVLFILYLRGVWLVDGSGLPIYTDFACEWIAALLALHGQTGSLYDPAEFLKIQAELTAPTDSFYAIWEYPPTFLLALAPFAMLPYVAAFLSWSITTLLGCMAVVYLIVRKLPAIALVLASPFSAWNFLAGQNGFLTASLLGASLLSLPRRPVLAGVFVGCLTYKPHFGILFPLALAASGQWRAFASAAAAALLLACGSVVVFGPAVWEFFPLELTAQAKDALFTDPSADPRAYFGHLQTVYGLLGYLSGGAALAWLAQGVTTCGTAAIVWMVWRSRVSYALKAATLSAAVLIATPYAHTYDMAALVIPVAFLASDQIRDGLLRGEQTIMVGLFGTVLAVLFAFSAKPVGPTFGTVPVGAVVTITLLGVILRRALWDAQRPTVFGSRAHESPHE
jgi:arabinofuranan 3-O-arabinosyltransferase